MMQLQIVTPFTIAALCVYLCRALEEVEPEVFLRPRNFNPHPYEIAYEPSGRQDAEPIYENQIDNTGPVLFPSNPSDNTTPNPYAAPLKEDHPINRHPYAGVAKKKKYTLGLGRYREERVNPQIYKALAAHGARVLKIPQAKDLKNVPFDPAFSDQKKDYAFSYKVVDHLTGDDFSHSQSQNAQATNGEYRVKLPDGRIQIVSYTADKNGYKADVKYAENEQYRPVEIAPRPTHYPYSYDGLPEQRIADYSENYQLPQLPRRIAPATLINKYELNQQVISVTPRPLFYEADPELIIGNKYRRLPEKVQRYSNIHEPKVRKFISPTLATYTLDSSKTLGLNVAVSTLAPDLDKFNPVYIDAPQYKLPVHYHKK